jgi:hypothetical protein
MRTNHSLLTLALLPLAAVLGHGIINCSHQASTDVGSDIGQLGWSVAEEDAGSGGTDPPEADAGSGGTDPPEAGPDSAPAPGPSGGSDCPEPELPPLPDYPTDVLDCAPTEEDKFDCKDQAECNKPPGGCIGDGPAFGCPTIKACLQDLSLAAQVCVNDATEAIREWREDCHAARPARLAALEAHCNCLEAENPGTGAGEHCRASRLGNQTTVDTDKCNQPTNMFIVTPAPSNVCTMDPPAAPQ